MTAKYTSAERARQERTDGNLVEAGEWYTSAAYQAAGEGSLYPSSGREIKYLLSAATCYRIGGRLDRCRNRCQTGILRAEDLSGRALSGPMPDHDIHHADRGTWLEAIGLLRQVGDLDGATAAYERARDVFEAAGDPLSHRAEHPRTMLYGWFHDLEHGVTGEVKGVSFQRTETYTEYMQYVSEKAPQYLDTLEQRGEWPGFEQ